MREWAKVNKADRTEKATDTAGQWLLIRKKALDLLARREHSRAELERKLQQKLPHLDDPSQIPQLLQALENEALLSDERFTEAYINMRARKGYGPQRIQLELLEKGIDRELAASLLALRDDWDEVLRQTWRKKFNSQPQSYAEKVKHMRFLQYRGFAIEAIQSQLEHLDD